MSPPDAAGRVRELVEFALRRLPAMRLDDGAFCHEVAAPGLEPRGRSLRYTAIVLLGLLEAERAGLSHRLEAPRLWSLLRREADSLSAGDLGLLLRAAWRSGQSGEELIAALEARLGPRGTFTALEGLELSWIVIGLAAATRAADSEQARRLLDGSRGEQLRRADTPSGLILHRGTGWRRRFPNFATQIYGIRALVELAGGDGDPEALGAARRTADRLLELQRADGGWPWLYDVRRGAVVEPYEVYSVHQDAMAPAALLALADRSGERRYRDAALRGLEWIWGRNDLGARMLDAEAGILYRSIRRRPPLDRAAIYANTAGAYAGRSLLAGSRGPLELNRTDRPYHLGWVLEAWSGRHP